MSREGRFNAEFRGSLQRSVTRGDDAVSRARRRDFLSVDKVGWARGDGACRGVLEQGLRGDRRKSFEN